VDGIAEETKKLHERFKMETRTSSTQTIVVYPHRHLRIRYLCLTVIFSAFVLVMDAVIAWDFWTHYAIDPGSYAAAASITFATILAGLMARVVVLNWSQWQQDYPLIVINSQGLIVDNLLQTGKVSVPWQEIAWIAVQKTGMKTYLCIKLKDAPHWWVAYGNAQESSPLASPLLTIAQEMLSIPARQILQIIAQNFSQELNTYEIHLLPS
jgi:hypothetical protein